MRIRRNRRSNKMLSRKKNNEALDATNEQMSCFRSFSQPRQHQSDQMIFELVMLSPSLTRSSCSPPLSLFVSFATSRWDYMPHHQTKRKTRGAPMLARFSLFIRSSRSLSRALLIGHGRRNFITSAACNAMLSFKHEKQLRGDLIVP